MVEWFSYFLTSHHLHVQVTARNVYGLSRTRLDHEYDEAELYEGRLTLLENSTVQFHL